MNSLVHRWLHAVKSIPKHNATLGIAGLAIVGTTIACPALARTESAAAAGKSSAAAQRPVEASRSGRTAPLPAAAEPATPTASPTPATAASSPVAVAPTRAAAPFEKALVPDFVLQPNFFYCGPAATRLAVTAHGVAAPSMDDIAWMLGTTENGTNSAEDTTRVLNRLLGAGIYHTHEIPGFAATPAQMDQLRLDIVAAVSGGYAGVANVVGGMTDLSGGWHQYDGGHYVSIVGYGQGGTTMKIADPADTQGDGMYWVKTADLANWMATRGYSA